MTTSGRADLFGQRGHAVRFDWGLAGAEAVEASTTVIVDVLSFSTSVCVAVERGITVYPYRWKGLEAEDFAREHDAALAMGRLEAPLPDAPSALSLSPAALLAGPVVPRVVFPSPNGSTIATALDSHGSRVVVGCLRNARVVARWLEPLLRQGDSVAIIAAGERWGTDESLRPSLEDHLGAGAIISALAELGCLDMSVEAAAAAALFDATRQDLARYLADCVGGREPSRWASVRMLAWRRH